MLNLIWLNLALCIKFNLSSQGEKGLNYALLRFTLCVRSI